MHRRRTQNSPKKKEGKVRKGDRRKVIEQLGERCVCVCGGRCKVKIALKKVRNLLTHNGLDAKLLNSVFTERKGGTECVGKITKLIVKRIIEGEMQSSSFSFIYLFVCLFFIIMHNIHCFCIIVFFTTFFFWFYS